MPPKVTYTEIDIINAAYEIVREHGTQELSARRVAQKLGCSTRPVYSYFKSMADLEMAVLEIVKALLMQYTKKMYTEKVFLNMGTGLTLFARDENQLFKVLFLQGNDFKFIVDEFLNRLTENMKNDSRFTHMRLEDRMALLDKMWTYTFGLATLVCMGLFNDPSQKNIVNNLLEIGGLVIGPALAKEA